MFEDELLFEVEFDMLMSEGYSCPVCGDEPIEVGPVEEEEATYGKCEAGHLFYVNV